MSLGLSCMATNFPRLNSPQPYVQGPIIRAPLRDVSSFSTSSAEVQVLPVQEAVSPSPSSSPPASQGLPYHGEKALIVGAGPAGSTAAMYLARRGFTVEVHEKRAEPDADKVDTGRAYIIILIPRGKAALEELGVELPNDPHYLTAGSVRHSAKGKVSIEREAGNVTWSRAGLAQYLINAARKQYPDQISFHFQSDLSSLDMKAKAATFSSPSGQVLTSEYQLLVGADGAASKVRGVMQETIPGFEVEVSDSGREYKIYMNLSIKGNIEPPEFINEPGCTLHLWSAKDDPFMSFTTHRNPDETYSGTFSMKTGSWGQIGTLEEIEAILRTKFVGIPEEWIPLIAQQALSSPASSAGKRIRCSSLSHESVVLVGDAAHAVTPVFGQGANSSLESCRCLGEALDRSKGDVSKIPEVFDELRRPDAHALYEIDRKAFSFFRRKGPFDPDFLQLLSHIVVGVILSKIVPFLYGEKPKLFMLGSAPYSEILGAIERDSKGLLFLVIAIAIALIGKFALGLF